MKIERVWHDRRADDPNGQRDRRPIMQLRDDGVEESRVPVRWRDYEFPQIAEANYRDERCDRQLERTETSLVQVQDRKSHHAGNAQPGQQ